MTKMVMTQNMSLSTDNRSSPGLPQSLPKSTISSALPKKVGRRNSKENGSSNSSTKIRFNNSHPVANSFEKMNPSIPVITSFAMKEEGTSPGMPGENGNQMLSPSNIDELFLHLKSDTFSTIRYSAYRTALKLDALQKGLCLDIVRLGTVVGVFCQHGLGLPLGPVTSRGTTPSFTYGTNLKGAPNTHDDVIIEKQKAADILSGIFFAAGKVTHLLKPCLIFLLDYMNIINTGK